MTLAVQWIRPEDIEGEANLLLSSFEKKHGTIATDATPLEELVEIHLGIACEFEDFGTDGVLGQIDVIDKVIKINSGLDYSENPSMRGRFNFTLAHEGGGHFVLHRPLVLEKMRMPSLFGDDGQVILCRTEESKSPIEVQADMFAAFLLMPKKKIIPAFAEVLENCPLVDNLAEAQLVHRMADRFKVSRSAMKMRLDTLELITNRNQSSMQWV